MNRMFLLRLPQNPVLRAIAVAALVVLALLLFFLGTVIWLTLLAVGLVAALILRLFGRQRRGPRQSASGSGQVIEGEFEVVDDDAKARRELPQRREDP
ncbi:MAG TPA: hypothetical protein PKZ76_09770 [Xanthomonadaceae bacterium]|nr:hypothetical protein [Xanthomonadaceae bacterium]